MLVSVCVCMFENANDELRVTACRGLVAWTATAIISTFCVSKSGTVTKHVTIPLRTWGQRKQDHFVFY